MGLQAMHQKFSKKETKRPCKSARRQQSHRLEKRKRNGEFKNRTLDTRVGLVVGVVSGEPVVVPLITACLEGRCVSNGTHDLALALQELQCQSLARVPCNVAVHLVVR